MKKVFLPLFALLSLSSCSLNLTHDSTSIKQVKETKLNNGSTVRIGYTKPDASWKCLQLDRKSDYTALNSLKGMVKFGGEYQVLEEQALAYANEKHLKANYIFLYVPSETSVNNFSLSPLSQAQSSFYQCKNPPAVNNKIF